MDAHEPHVIYEFGEFQLDARRGLLRARSDGQTLELTPKALATLLYLVEHAGQLVEKGKLFAAVWPNVVVEEANLTQTIHVLRRALRERPDDHRFIVTVPGRGYRFVADTKMQTVQDPDPLASPVRLPPASSWRWRSRLIPSVLLVALLAAAIIIGTDPYRTSLPAVPARPIRSIAVLPFVDLSQSGDSAYFSEGLSEEVLTLLAQIPELRVIARTSSFSFKGQNVDIGTIAEQLNVAYVLEGSVRRYGSRVRITAQLIEASSSSHVWSETYERDLNDLLAVQIEIGAAVADALQARLPGGARPRLAAPRSLQAYEDFLRAEFFYNRRAPDDLDRALIYYQRALEIDPEYARAWAGVAAVSFVQTATQVWPGEVGLARLLDAARKTIALDPQLAEGHVRLACYYWLSGQYATGDEHFFKGVALNPDSSLVLSFLANKALRDGRFDEAIRIQRRALSLDPLSALRTENLGHTLFTAGRLDEAKAELFRALELSPDLRRAAGMIGQILVLQGRFDSAMDFIVQRTTGEEREQGLALLYHALGRSAEADAALARLITLSRDTDPFKIAEVYAYVGDADEAFRWLALATRKRDPAIDWFRGNRILWQMQGDPMLASLHDDPRWEGWIADSRRP